MALIAKFDDGCRQGDEGVEGHRKSPELFKLSRGVEVRESQLFDVENLS